MKRQDFTIEDTGWWITVFHGAMPDELCDVAAALIDAGESARNVAEAVSVLQRPNTGYTYTNYDNRRVVSVIGHATSSRQLANTLAHELKHIVEHLSTYYGVSPKSEQSGYLQGYIGARMIVFAYEKEKEN